jgi:hypothetical protein
MKTINTGPFRQLMHEVKYGHTTEDEAATRIDAHVELEVERALRKHGIEPAPIPNGEERFLRNMRELGKLDDNAPEKPGREEGSER